MEPPSESDSLFKEGDRITATATNFSGQRGTIKFIGSLPEVNGIWYGVELDGPFGKHDGTSKGVKYFECKPKHGVFFRAKNMIPCGSEGDVLLGAKPLDTSNTGTSFTSVPSLSTLPTLPTPSASQTNLLTTQNSSIFSQTNLTPTQNNNNPVISQMPSLTSSLPSQSNLATITTITQQFNSGLSHANLNTKDVKKNLKIDTDMPGPTSTLTTAKSLKINDESTKSTSKAADSHVPLNQSTTSKESTRDLLKKLQSTRSQARIDEAQQQEAMKGPEETPKVSTTTTVNMSQLHARLKGKNMEADISGDAKKLHEENRRLNEELKKLSLEVRNQQTDIENLKIINENYQIECENYKNQIEIFKTELNEQKETAKGLNDSLWAEREKNEKLAKLLKEKESISIEEAVDSEYKKKFLEVHAKLQEQQKANKELEHRIQSLTRDLQELDNKDAKLESLEKLIDKLTLEKEDLENTKEYLELQLEEEKLKVEQLQEEKELQEYEAEEAIMASGEGEIGELRLENLKLKQAVKKLYETNQIEMIKMEEKLKRANAKLENLPKIEEKEKIIEQLQQQLRKKDGEIEDLKLLVDEANESLLLVEKLTEENLLKEDEIIELKRELTAAKKNAEADRQLVEEYEDYIKMLEKENDDRDYQIILAKNKLDEQKKIEDDLEKAIQKHREKIGSLNSQLELYKQKSSNNDDKRLLQKIDELSQKILENNNSRREHFKSEVNRMIENLIYRADVLKGNIILSILPQNISERICIDALNKYILTKQVKDKAFYFIEELKNQYLMTKILAMENLDMIKWIKKISLTTLDIIQQTDIIESKFYSFNKDEDLEAYMTFTKTYLFNQLMILNALLEQFYNHLKDETLSTNVSIETYVLVINKIKELTESICEIPASQNSKCKKLFNHAGILILELVNYLENRGIAYEKMTRFYYKIEEILQNLHKGKYKNEEETNRLHDTNIGILTSLIEYLEKTIQQIPKEDPENINVKEIENLIENEISKLAVYIFNTDYNITSKGPWTYIINKLKSEIEQVEETAVNFDKTSNQLKEQLRLNALMQSELKDYKKSKETLEKRVGELQIKAERVVTLENEKRRLMEKENHFAEASERIKQQLENAEKRNKELEEDIAKLKGLASVDTNKDRAKDGNNRASLQQRMKMSIMRDDKGGIPVGMSEEDLDDYLNIISKLTSEASSAKCFLIKTKLQSIKDSTPYFSKCMEHYKRRKETVNEYSDDQVAKFNMLLKNIKNADNKLLNEMSQATIVNIDTLINKPISEKLPIVKNLAENTNLRIESIKAETIRCADKFVEIFNKNKKKTSFKAYIPPELQKIINGESGNMLGELSFNNTNDQNKVRIMHSVI